MKRLSSTLSFAVSAISFALVNHEGLKLPPSPVKLELT